MPEQRTRRRRKRRPRRGGRRGEGSPEVGAEAPENAEKAQARPGSLPVTWQWRTFPVFLAFVGGGLLVVLIAPQPNTTLYSVLFFAFLGAGAFGVAHIVTRLIIARRGR